MRMTLVTPVLENRLNLLREERHVICRLVILCQNERRGDKQHRQAQGGLACERRCGRSANHSEPTPHAAETLVISRGCLAISDRDTEAMALKRLEQLRSPNSSCEGVRKLLQGI